MQKHLAYLLDKYSVAATAELKGSRVVAVNGKDLPLLPWRSERRIVELAKLVSGKEITGISVMRTLRITHKGEDLLEAAYREFDIAQYILGSRIREIFAIGDTTHALNIIAKTADGYVCTFELSATLAAGTPIVDKHEIIAISGVACDRAADTQMPQDSVYVLGREGTAAYTDVDAELFGLTVDQCAVVREAFATAKDGTDLSGDTAYLMQLVEAAKASLAACENIIVEV